MIAAGTVPIAADFWHIESGGTFAVSQWENIMSLADVCLLLAALCAFATLILKVVEVARGN